ncbi:MAG TPA: class I SAM-dependent methyltransferase [Acidimicrobiales bacterium]|nr:class I SAM-dependent methyltransferase [Acidimicrobiales bacterium]
MSVDARYTDEDHDFRKDDTYARTKYEITIDWLGPARPGNEVLYHVGCGVGIFNRMAAEAGYTVEAFEPDPRAFEVAARDAAGHACRVHLSGLEAIEGEAVADVLVMHDVLEHIEDEAGAVACLHRLLKPGGRLILSVPALQSLFGYHDRQLGHYRRYKKRTLRAALENAFTIQRLRYFGMSFIPVTLLFSRILQRPYPTSAAGEEQSLLSSTFDRLCAAEARVAMPIGTSLLCDATARR